MSDIEAVSQAARLMVEDHGPEHERHSMWAAMGGLLDAASRSMLGTSQGETPFEAHIVRVAQAYLQAR